MLPGSPGGFLMISIPKDKLRPVSYVGWGSYQGEIFKGWFHGWTQEADENGKVSTVAIVELPSGEVRLPYAARVQFDDR